MWGPTLASFRKVTTKVIPVTAEISGERVIVGETTLVVPPPPRTEPEVTPDTPEFPEVTCVDLDTPEGLTVEAIKNKGLENAISVRSDRPDLVQKLAEQNKKFKEENPDDGTVGFTDANPDYSGS